MQKKIRLAKPMIYKKSDLLRRIHGIISSSFFTQGKYIEEFEKCVADYVCAKYAIAVSSGTAALHLALLSCGIGSKDKVIVPDFTFPATANVVELVGAVPVLADIDLDTLNLDLEKVLNFLSLSRNRVKLKAIMIVHQFGRPIDFDKVKFISKKYKLLIIEDAACALGAEYNRKKCGTLGSVGIFSFHPRKVICTGEGGMIVTDNNRIARSCIELRNHGLVNKKATRRVEAAGFNYRLAEIPSLLGLTQMAGIEENIKKRINIARYYQKNLSGIEGLISPRIADKMRHTFQTYAVLLNKADDRDKLKSVLIRNNIEAGVYEYAIHKQPYYQRKYKLEDSRFKNSLSAAKRVLALPMYPQLTKDDIKIITNKIRSYFNGDKR